MCGTNDKSDVSVVLNYIITQTAKSAAPVHETAPFDNLITATELVLRDVRLWVNYNPELITALVPLYVVHSFLTPP